MCVHQVEIIAAVLCDKLLRSAYIFIVFLCLMLIFICINLLFCVRNL